MLIAISVLIAIFISLFFLIYKNNTHLNKIPKPQGSFILGHIGIFSKPTETLKILTNYATSGGGVVKIYIPPVKPSLLITDSKFLQYVLSSDKILEKSKDYRFFKPWLGTGLVTAEATKWKYRRRILTPCFGRLTLLKHFTDKFNSLGDVLIETLNEELHSPSFDIFPLMKMYTLDVICETSMGVSINAQRNGSNDYAKSIEQLCKTIANRFTTPHKRFDLIYRFTEDYKKETEALKVIGTFFDDIMEKRYKRTQPEAETCVNPAFLDLLMQHNQNGRKFSLSDLREEVNTFMFGGHDTVATGISFTLYELARHRAIQDKVIEEQKNIFGDITGNISPSYNDLQQMKYLELVINEALRLYPPIPVIARKLTSDVCLDNGMVLPKNLTLCMFIYGCHRNPKYFRDPEKFIPERFDEDEIQPFTYMPFSAGPRNCVGKKFAILQMKSCISKILRNFVVLPSKPAHNLELVGEVTLVAKNGIHISLEKRNTNGNQK